MRSILLTATLVTAIVLGGCPYDHPVPGTQSSAGAALHFGAAHGGQPQAPASAAAPGEINYFQGSLDEAFARPPCPFAHGQLRGGGAPRYN